MAQAPRSTSEINEALTFSIELVKKLKELLHKEPNFDSIFKPIQIFNDIKNHDKYVEYEYIDKVITDAYNYIKSYENQ